MWILTIEPSNAPIVLGLELLKLLGGISKKKSRVCFMARWILALAVVVQLRRGILPGARVCISNMIIRVRWYQYAGYIYCLLNYSAMYYVHTGWGLKYYKPLSYTWHTHTHIYTHTHTHTHIYIYIYIYIYIKLGFDYNSSVPLTTIG